MYHFVDKAEIKQFKSTSSRILECTRDYLKEEYGIIGQFALVGSGRRNLVTQNGNGLYDLDYNLQVVKMPDKYWANLGLFKETVRTALNKTVKGTHFVDGRDSTSVITTLWFNDKPNVKAGIDVAILAQNPEGTWCRLIHNKSLSLYGSQGQYTWCEVPSSKDVAKKDHEIKNYGQWKQVRDVYLDLKNLYFERQDLNHPSFVCYVEAVNQVYYQLFGKGGNRR